MNKKNCYYVGVKDTYYGYCIIAKSAKIAKKLLYQRLIDEYDVEYTDIRVRMQKTPYAKHFPEGFVFDGETSHCGLDQEQTISYYVMIGIYQGAIDLGFCLSCRAHNTDVFHVNTFPFCVCESCYRAKNLQV